MSRCGPRRCRERGQATVELALALPVVLLALLAVLQVGLVVHDRLLVTNAAREAARAAAVEPTIDVARAAARRAGGLDPSRLEVTLSNAPASTASVAPGPGGGPSPGDRITAAVRYRSPTRVPLVGHLIPDIELGSEVTMRVE